MYRIGVIGTGNMGGAILSGVLNKKNNYEFVIYDKNMEQVNRVKENYSITIANDNISLVKQCKYIILAIKPQYFVNVLEEIKEYINDHIIISIAPGITTTKIKKYVGVDKKIVRIMPNTPALVGEGMSVLSFSKDAFTKEEKNVVVDIFESVGKVVELEEQYMDAVVPISGSSPAYAYIFIEALADSGVLYGLPRDIAYKLAAQTLLGSAKMVLDTGKHPGELKDQVCSPGGTTIEAVTELEKNGFRNAIIEAVKACYEKTKKLGK